MTTKKTAAKKTAAKKTAAKKAVQKSEPEEAQLTPHEWRDREFVLESAISFIRAQYPVPNNMREDRYVEHAKESFDYAESMLAEAKRREVL